MLLWEYVECFGDCYKIIFCKQEIDSAKRNWQKVKIHCKPKSVFYFHFLLVKDNLISFITLPPGESALTWNKIGFNADFFCSYLKSRSITFHHLTLERRKANQRSSRPLKYQTHDQSTVPSIELPASPAYITKINRAALLQDPHAIKSRNFHAFLISELFPGTHNNCRKSVAVVL